MSSLLSVADAQRRLLSALKVTETEEIPLDQANGRVLSETILAGRDSPAFANSSMDGFALRAADLAGLEDGAAKELKVIGDIPAGTPSSIAVRAGQAMRIMTGAALPEGADAVVPVEDTDVAERGADAALPQSVQVRRAVESGAFVRPIGEDFRQGQSLMEIGLRMRAQELALLAMLGRSKISAYRKPRVALFSSGDELLELGQKLTNGKIYESNSYSLAAQIESCGAQVLNLGIAADDLVQIVAKLDSAIEMGADLIVSSAGVSVGAYDYLREALQTSGQLDFWRVNMRPGKPLAFGNYRNLPFIGLPGNPVSSFVSFEVFARPALMAMAGERAWSRLTFSAQLTQAVHSGGRQSYLRAQYRKENGATVVSLTEHQGSGNLYSLVQANCLIVVPAGTTEMKAGSKVETWPIW